MRALGRIGIVVGVLVGVVIGVLKVGVGNSGFQPAAEARRLGQSPIAVDSASGSPHGTAVSPSRPHQEREPVQSFSLDADVSFEAAWKGERFLGYRVIKNSGEDQRFAVDEIIVEVNGQAVEGSAAGSELLLVGLADSRAPVKTMPEMSND